MPSTLRLALALAIAAFAASATLPAAHAMDAMKGAMHKTMKKHKKDAMKGGAMKRDAAPAADTPAQ